MLSSVSEKLCYRMVRWLRHVAHMFEDRLSLEVTFSQLSGAGIEGRPRRSGRVLSGGTC